MNDYMWLAKTDKGDFLVTVLGDWTAEQAERKLRLIFEAIHIEILALVPRKRASGPQEMDVTIYQDTAHPLGLQLLAGAGLWKACGRGDEYKTQLAAALKDVKDGHG